MNPQEEKSRLSYPNTHAAAQVESSAAIPEPPVFIKPEIRIEQVEPVNKVTSEFQII